MSVSEEIPTNRLSLDFNSLDKLYIIYFFKDISVVTDSLRLVLQLNVLSTEFHSESVLAVTTRVIM